MNDGKENDFTQNTVLTSYKANFIGNVQQNIFSYLMQQQNVYLLKLMHFFNLLAECSTQFCNRITQYFTTTPCTEDTLASNGLDSDFFFCSADGKAAVSVFTGQFIHGTHSDSASTHSGSLCRTARLPVVIRVRSGSLMSRLRSLIASKQSRGT